MGPMSFWSCGLNEWPIDLEDQYGKQKVTSGRRNIFRQGGLPSMPMSQIADRWPAHVVLRPSCQLSRC